MVVMTTPTYFDRKDWEALAAADVDPMAELDAVTNSLQMAQNDITANSTSLGALIELHAALFVFQLGGQARLLPHVGLASFGKRGLERKIVKAAGNMMHSSSSDDASFIAWKHASDRIEMLIGLLDRDLAYAAA
jgi:hypothetical protein